MSMTDWLDAVVFLLGRDDVAGPVNLVGPAPVRNLEFTKALGELLHRPTVLPVPAVVLRTLLSEFGRDALASKRVLPGVLRRAGFTFTHPDLRSALRAALTPPPVA
jgi:NAD dependent epimerase/dehydratase family enzyme